MIQLMNLWSIGNRKDNVTPLVISGAYSVSHIDKRPSRIFSKMRLAMSKVEEIGREEIKFEYHITNGTVETFKKL